MSHIQKTVRKPKKRPLPLIHMKKKKLAWEISTTNSKKRKQNTQTLKQCALALLMSIMHSYGPVYIIHSKVIRSSTKHADKGHFIHPRRMPRPTLLLPSLRPHQSEREIRDQNWETETEKQQTPLVQPSLGSPKIHEIQEKNYDSWKIGTSLIWLQLNLNSWVICWLFVIQLMNLFFFVCVFFFSIPFWKTRTKHYDSVWWITVSQHSLRMTKIGECFLTRSLNPDDLDNFKLYFF